MKQSETDYRINPKNQVIMYEVRQDKEKVNRKIEVNGGARQRVKMKLIGSTIQRKWVKGQDGQYQWDKIENGLLWSYNENTKKMFYAIENQSVISKEHLEWYAYFNGQEKSYYEWCRIFQGNLKRYAAIDASMHTSGNYKARNAVISILTKYKLLEECLNNNWNIQNLQNHEQILSEFKVLYEKITKEKIPSDIDPADVFETYLGASLPIIKGFKQLGTGDEDLVGTIVNRGDSEDILDSMGLSDIKKLTNGIVQYNKKMNFPGVTSTNRGEDIQENQYAKNSAVIWILTIGEKHHGFDFKKMINEGYGSENELTFPMGVEVDIKSISIGDVHYPKAKYIIQGIIY